MYFNGIQVSISPSFFFFFTPTEKLMFRAEIQAYRVLHSKHEPTSACFKIHSQKTHNVYLAKEAPPTLLRNDFQTCALRMLSLTSVYLELMWLEMGHQDTQTLCWVGIRWCKDKCLQRHNDVGCFWQVELDRRFIEVFDGSNSWDGTAATTRRQNRWLFCLQNFTLPSNASECNKKNSLFLHLQFQCLECKCLEFEGICLCPAGLPCPRVQFFSLRRQLPRETQSPAWFRARSFSETAVCYGSKDGITKDGGGDGGKVWSCFVKCLAVGVGWGRTNLTRKNSLTTRLSTLRKQVAFCVIKWNRKHQSLNAPFSFSGSFFAFSPGSKRLKK